MDQSNEAQEAPQNNVLPAMVFHMVHDALLSQDKAQVENLWAQRQTPTTNPVNWNIEHINRKDLALLGEMYSGKFSRYNPFLLKYLNANESERLKKELQYYFYIVSARMHIDTVENRKQHIQDYREQLEYCANLVTVLDAAQAEKDALIRQLFPQPEPQQGYNFVPQFIKERLAAFRKSKANAMCDMVNDINGRRLYWVWGSAMMAEVIPILSHMFIFPTQPLDVMNEIGYCTGNLGWSLYSLHALVDLLLVAKHTVRWPWMSDEEKRLGAWKRLCLQLEQRKFNLINFIGWGFSNAAGQFWLKGKGFHGYMGNVVCAFFLLVDIGASIWKFHEKYNLHVKALQKFDVDIAVLRTLGDGHRQALAALEKDKRDYERRWKYEYYGLINDVTYALGLFASFAVLASLLIPPKTLVAKLPASAGLTMSLAGGILCFAVSYVYTGVGECLKIAKAKETARVAKADCVTMLAELRDRMPADGSPVVDLDTKKMFLELRQALVVYEEARQLANYQIKKSVRVMLVDAFIPLVFTASFACLPLAAAIGVVAGFIAFAALSYLALRVLAAPKSLETVSDFDEMKCRQLVATDPSELKTLGKRGFFQPHIPNEPAVVQPILEGPPVVSAVPSL